MDYAREVTNARTWAAQMAAAGVDGVTIAEPVDALCTETVLTTRWVEGERAGRGRALVAQGRGRAVWAPRGHW